MVPFSLEISRDRLVDADKQGADGLSTWQTEVLTKLLEWFGVEFHLVNGTTGELMHCSLAETASDWPMRGQLCRAVAAARQAEFIEEQEPLLILAIPVRAANDECVVAVGTFVTSHNASDKQLTKLSAALGLEPADTGKWIHRQRCWAPDVLLNMGRLAGQRLTTREQLKSLSKEVKELSAHLSATYEEIGLLYRLTQNLKLSSKPEDLAQMAVDWLAEVVPAKALAIQLTVSKSAPAGAQPILVTHGSCPLDCDDVTRMIARLKPSARPLVLNAPVTEGADWPWPEARQLAIVPLAEGENCFGWLMAINHARGGEFGTVEASLLSSVGVILGIHSGNTELYQQQREFFAGVVRALTSAIDAKDPYTCGHSDRVARVSVRLAEEMGCNRKQVDTIYLSGLLHDVGKIGVDDNVLRKPGKLTAAEYEHIKAHAEIGFKILSDIKQLDEVLPVVLHHHEQWDGKGYPHGLSGEAIPYLARIVAVADSFDAMSSDRPYRSGICDEKLDTIMRDGAGSQWDAEIVSAFFRARADIRKIAQQHVKSMKLEFPDLV